MNEITVRIPSERDPRTGEPTLRPGPVGEYVEVVDVDPASGLAYAPVNLDEAAILAEDGLPPSEGNPQFHQQMAYAVAMVTIGNFERALGRVALWSPRRSKDGMIRQFVRRLRIYPHALRGRNSFYSPEKKAILLGYFPVRTKDAHNTPGTIVFSCLSHDIITHEVTHALLDGIHPRFNEATNPDVHAFHEAFADLVALFQHFSYPGVLHDQIVRARGDLSGDTLLAKLAQQFGRATGRGSALRDALGREGSDGIWRRTSPNARALETVVEPHDRGAILVAAIFAAFILVYQARTADLFRIATQGTGILPAGDIHPDLAKRLAEEATKISQHVLQMVIRALDYCPPVDITFGDYLKAVITADLDLNPEDEYGYRVAMIQSFRQWGIHPRKTRSMSVESLTWPDLREARMQSDTGAQGTGAVLLSEVVMKSSLDETTSAVRNLIQEEQPPEDDDEGPDSPEVTPILLTALPAPRSISRSSLRFEPWTLDSDRRKMWNLSQSNAKAMHRWLLYGQGSGQAANFGLVLDKGLAPLTVYTTKHGKPAVEVHAVRRAVRRSPRGALVADLVVEMTQRRKGYFSPKVQERMDLGDVDDADYTTHQPDFVYRAGCTLLIDPVTSTVRRVIRTSGTIADNAELARVREFMTGGFSVSGNAFDSGLSPSRAVAERDIREPFAMLHRYAEG
ncbi:gluzincin family metallopeptidase [Muricoccus nepalensis]|nr:hypothetical protein [Roseomonas nepalensis]